MNKEPVQITALQLFGTTLTAIGVFLYYMNGFLTLREHNEFVSRFNADIARLTAEQINQNNDLGKRVETRQSQHEAKLALDSLNSRIQMLQDQLNRLSDREDQRHRNDKP